MKIAFDATVVHGAKSGIGYYSQELLRSLVALDGPDRYFAFSHRPLTSDFVRPSHRLVFSTSGFCPVRAVYMHGILPRMLEHESPDLVHYTNFIAPLGYRHRYVVTVHDMTLERHVHFHPISKRLYTRRLIPPSARGAELVITGTEYSKWEIVRWLGIPEDRIRVVPLAPAAIFTPQTGDECARVRRCYALDRGYFIYVGNIDPRKNLVRLLEAFARVGSAGVQLVIAGADWFGRTEVDRAVGRLGLGDRVRFLGYVPRSDLPALMAGALAFVYPSLTEGFGLPVVEAMASGVPVITSSTGALREVAADAALLVDPRDTATIAGALDAVSRDAALRTHLSLEGLRRASLYSWRATAESTRAVYHEAVDRVQHGRRYAVRGPSAVSEAAVDRAVGRTLAYARQFDFPLTVVELRERLFDVGASLAEVEAAVTRLGIPVIDGHLTPTAALVEERRRREKKTAAVLRDTWKEIRFIARFPFVRMVALSGAAAHGNMTDADVDLFAVVEHRRLWFVLAATTVWAKLRGIRGVICLNYLVSDRALALPDTDGFTAQQAASLKPIFGKDVYDRFLAANPFVRRTFPNFEPARHRDRYPEVSPSWWKEILEAILRWGPGAAGESASRIVFGRYLRSKAGRREDAARDPFDAGDVVLETTRIKLHLRSHRHAAISALEAEAPPATPRAGGSAGGSVARALAPDADRGREKNAKVHAG